MDLNILTETIACLPSIPPNHILQVSPLTVLLTDPSVMPFHYISVASVNRLDNGGRHMSSYPLEEDNEIATTALNALRIASIPRA